MLNAIALILIQIMNATAARFVIKNPIINEINDGHKLAQFMQFNDSTNVIFSQEALLIFVRIISTRAIVTIIATFNPV